MYKLEFTLKQHTPLIHFQHHQYGATLRASEVKPKLDRFLIEKITNKKGAKATEYFKLKTSRKIKQENVWIDNPEFNDEWLQLLIGNSNKHLAFDYKISLSDNNRIPLKFYFTSNPSSRRNDDSYINTVRNEFNAQYINKTQYFANNSNLKPNRVENSGEVKLGLYSGNIEGRVITTNNVLYQVINDIIFDFFLSQNFGSRQSKGFGCFTVIKIQNQEKQFDESHLVNCYQTVYKMDAEISDYIQALQKIAQVYKLIRSGQGANDNENGGYKKSLLFLYFLKLPNPLRWEKRKIKKEIKLSPFYYLKQDRTTASINLTYNHAPCYDQTNGMNWNDPAPPNIYQYSYVRALLGLNETLEFLADSIIDGRDRNGNDNEVKFKYIVQVKSNNGIERFKSPITCKYIEGHIYICANPVSNEILHTSSNPISFNFDLRLKQNNHIQNNNLYERDNFVSNFKTPSTFDIIEFLKFCFTENHTNKINGFTVVTKTIQL